jgi:hypothetical protein
MVNDNIQILGLEKFNEKEQKKIVEFSESYYEKINRKIEGNLVLHAKKHNKDGNRCMYSFHAKVQFPEEVLTVNDDDWILSTALHKTLKKVENHIDHKYKTN